MLRLKTSPYFLFSLVAMFTASAHAENTALAPEPVEPVSQPKTSMAQGIYRVRILPEATKLGERALTAIEIIPGEGYKINLEFPSKLKLDSLEGVRFEKDTLLRGDAEQSAEMLRFPVYFTTQNTGTLALSATLDFSLCTETTCKLLRGERLSWEVKVE